MTQKALQALRLLHDFQGVERVIFVPGNDRQENDVEHSYLLAMLAWQLAEVLAPALDRAKVIRYALVHDLVEVYAGDVFFYDTHSHAAQHKAEREHAAMMRLVSEGVLGADICASLVAYEARNDDEACFVYALDKVIPIMTIYLDGGRTWKTCGVTIADLVRLKRDKVACSPVVLAFFDELVEVLRTHEQALFS